MAKVRRHIKDRESDAVSTGRKGTQMRTGMDNKRNANLLYQPMPTAAPNSDKLNSARSTTTREKQVREE